MFLGMNLVIDHCVPEGEIQLRNKAGIILGKIIRRRKMKMEEKKDRVVKWLKGDDIEGVKTFVHKGTLYRWFSPTEIGLAVIPHSDLTAPSSVASPVCKALVEDGVLERNSIGWYRLKR